MDRRKRTLRKNIEFFLIFYALSILIGINIEFYTKPIITAAENPSQKPIDLAKKVINLDDITSFDILVIEFPKGMNLENHNSIVIWFESLPEFIISTKYSHQRKLSITKVC